MATDLRRRPAAVAPANIPLLARFAGLGTIFGKTIRDSRRAMILIGGVLGVLLVAISTAIIAQFPTAASRTELGDVIRAVPPILAGLAGRVVNIETLGGYVQYKYGTFFPILASLWLIIAMSGTLAGEARRGSLELVASTGMTRRAIAGQKLLGYLAALAIASVLIFFSLLAVGVSAKLPGDAIPVSAAAGYALWLALLALIAGSLAFALSQFFGRGAGIGIAGAVMFGGFILNGYQAAIPSLAPFANLTWFGWTANHIPLAGLYDWPSLALTGVAAVAFLMIGVEAFVRRDLGATTTIPTPGLPRALIGLRGPAGRVFGQTLPTALSWGLGIGLFGLLIAGSGQGFVDQLSKSPEFARLLNTVFPGVDIGTVGGFLQLAFVEFGFILAGLSAATLVGGWASDETSGRLEFLLATPLARARWVVSGGAGVFGGIAVITIIAMAGIAIGASITGGDIGTPIVGTLSLSLFAVAMAGIGIAFGGVFGSGYAAMAVAVATILTWIIDILAPAFKLPDAVHQLALTAHYGLPMLGRWDVAGVIASLVLAVGGVAIGVAGFRRRDLRS
jgi:ABC-2 type transport system permease protein